MAECLAAASDFKAMAPLQQHAAHNSKGGVASHWLNTQAKYGEPYDQNYPLKFQHSLIFNMIFYEYPDLYISSPLFTPVVCFLLTFNLGICTSSDPGSCPSDSLCLALL